jgi:hypothetical protein
MRNPTLVAVAGGGLAAALALGAAVPALASSATPGSTAAATRTSASTSTSTSPAAAPLTGAELVTIDRFYETHPVLGHRLVARIDAWKTFLANHPDFAAEVAKWRELPPNQRRAAERAWLADHPAVRHDVAQLRADRREFRHDLRELRRDLRRGSATAAS